MLKFETKTNSVGLKASVAIATAIVTHYNGKTSKRTIALRAIETSNGIQLSKAFALGDTWLPWEAIGLAQYKTLGSARNALRVYAKENSIK